MQSVLEALHVKSVFKEGREPKAGCTRPADRSPRTRAMSTRSPLRRGRSCRIARLAEAHAAPVESQPELPRPRRLSPFRLPRNSRGTDDEDDETVLLHEASTPRTSPPKATSRFRRSAASSSCWARIISCDRFGEKQHPQPAAAPALPPRLRAHARARPQAAARPAQAREHSAEDQRTST